MSFAEHSYKLATLAVESFGCRAKEDGNLTDQVAASIVGETDGSSPARKDVFEERLFQIIAVTTQVQTNPEGPPGREGKEGRSWRTATNDLGME